MENENNLKFNEAYKELERISEELQNQDLDLDLLIVKVKRAAELIKYCKTSLSHAESEIGQIIIDVNAFVKDTEDKEIKTEKDNITEKDDDSPF
jgi:exodeoxyribonuclease VII small subunit